MPGAMQPGMAPEPAGGVRDRPRTSPGRRGMADLGTTFGIPLPPGRTPVESAAQAGHAGRLVADFLSAASALSCEAAAELAGVRPETIRGWRRRLPRGLKGATSRRMTAFLAGVPFPRPDESLRRSFQPVLRRASLAEHGVLAAPRTGVPP